MNTFYGTPLYERTSNYATYWHISIIDQQERETLADRLCYAADVDRLSMEDYAEFFPSPDPSRDNDPQLTIIDDANEDFGLQLYRAHMVNLHEFLGEEIDHIIHSPLATMNDLHWSQAARRMTMKQFNAAYHAKLGQRYGYGQLTFNR